MARNENKEEKDVQEMLLSFLIRYLSRTQQTPLSLSHTHGTAYLVILFFFVFKIIVVFISFSSQVSISSLCYSLFVEVLAAKALRLSKNFGLSTFPVFRLSQTFNGQKYFENILVFWRSKLSQNRNQNYQNFRHMSKICRKYSKYSKILKSRFLRFSNDFQKL